jgi:hypothetical protein
LGVAEVLCDFDRDGGGAAAPNSPKPDEVRPDLVREGAFDTLSDPDDLDVTSLSLVVVEVVRTDLVRTRPGFGPVATLVESSPDFVLAGFFAKPPPQNPQEAEAPLRLTFARSLFGDTDLGAATGSGGGVGGFA